MCNWQSNFWEKYMVEDEDDYVRVKKVLDFGENAKGCPNKFKLRNLYYF